MSEQRKSRTTVFWTLGMSSSEQKEIVSVGDEVMFIWSGMHNVWRFSNRKAFDDCDFSQAVELAPKTENKFRYTAKDIGKFYFSCEIPGHCDLGQKLELLVTPGTFSYRHALSSASVVLTVARIPWLSDLLVH